MVWYSKTIHPMEQLEALGDTESGKRSNGVAKKLVPVKRFGDTPLRTGGPMLTQSLSKRGT